MAEGAGAGAGARGKFKANAVKEGCKMDDKPGPSIGGGRGSEKREETRIADGAKRSNLQAPRLGDTQDSNIKKK